MTEGTQRDWEAIAASDESWCAALPGRVLAHLQLLAGTFGGFAVDRLEHSLQTATRRTGTAGTTSTSCAPCCTTSATR